MSDKFDYPEMVNKAMQGKVVKDFREEGSGIVIEFTDGWFIRIDTYQQVVLEWQYTNLETAARGIDG